MVDFIVCSIANNKKEVIFLDEIGFINFLYIIAYVVITIGLCFLVYKIIEKIKESYYNKLRIEVLNSSKNIKALHTLNEKYINRFIHLQEKIIVTSPIFYSKSQYDRFVEYGYEKYMLEYVNKYESEIAGIIYRAEMNNISLSEYEKEVKALPYISPEAIAEECGISLEKYCNIEHDLFSERILSPITDPIFVLNISYTSPQGRNHYVTKMSYNISEIKEQIQIAKKQIKQENLQYNERKKMTQKLRYEIIMRDGKRCVLCGRSVEDGVKLEVDHIKPISKGGKTIKSNLRTLCEDCNRGKRDSYDESGLN